MTLTESILLSQFFAQLLEYRYFCVLSSYSRPLSCAVCLPLVHCCPVCPSLGCLPPPPPSDFAIDCQSSLSVFSLYLERRMHVGCFSLNLEPKMKPFLSFLCSLFVARNYSNDNSSLIFLFLGLYLSICCGCCLIKSLRFLLFFVSNKRKQLIRITL